MTSSLPVWLPSYKSFFLSSILCFPLIQMCLTQVTFSHPPQGFLHCFLNKATCLTDLPTLLSEHLADWTGFGRQGVWREAQRQGCTPTQPATRLFWASAWTRPRPHPPVYLVQWTLLKLTPGVALKRNGSTAELGSTLTEMLTSGRPQLSPWHLCVDGSQNDSPTWGPDPAHITIIICTGFWTCLVDPTVPWFNSYWLITTLRNTDSNFSKLRFPMV